MASLTACVSATPASRTSAAVGPRSSAAVGALLASWRGPYGGLPPLDIATPESIGAACDAAIANKRAEVQAIVGNTAPPTFDNTIAALENAGRELQRVRALLDVFASTMNTGTMPEVTKRVTPLLAALDNEIALDDKLLARIDTVFATRHTAGLSADQQRLTELIRGRMLRQGASLADDAKKRLVEINGKIAGLQAQFSQNLLAEESSQAVYLDDEEALAGLPPALRTAAAAAAKSKGRPGGWAIPNSRPMVWPFLINAERRDLREKVWRMWILRGDNPGEHDNKPIITEILRLRGEKARLLGYANYADFATADRMAGNPQKALALLQDVWGRVIDPTSKLVAELQGIATAEGAKFELAPWDRLYYSEKLRRVRFGFDSEAVKPYLKLDSILQAMFWAAGRVHGLKYTEIPAAPVPHPDIHVYAVSRAGEPVGIIYIDLYARPGKQRGSWSTEYRPAESFHGKVLPVVALMSNVERSADGSPPLLTWEVANVLFHEFGHTLHTLNAQTRYPSLGSMSVPWDFVEAPALLNERWFYDRELLQRFARHYQTNAAIPRELLEKIERAAKFDRIFSLNLDYLAPAIVDMKLHLLADGRDIDAVTMENQLLAELGMPAAWDEIMRVTHNVHAFSFQYAAGVYSYLWSDAIAADIAEAFDQSPGGLYDAATAERWRRTLLSSGNSVPIEQAFRNFRGRDPSPAALLRRFGLE
jgi:peptidyl-dipeptidase Dcp